MIPSRDDGNALDEQTIDVIAERVIALLRDDLETIAAALSVPAQPGEQLTVDQVARRLGVTRSTVYAHWREWGGYKLGDGAKAPIRFDSDALLAERPRPQRQRPMAVDRVATRRRRRRRQRRDLLRDAPRLVSRADEVV